MSRTMRKRDKKVEDVFVQTVIDVCGGFLCTFGETDNDITPVIFVFVTLEYAHFHHFVDEDRGSCGSHSGNPHNLSQITVASS